jgi:hypothetical protein
MVFFEAFVRKTMDTMDRMAYSLDGFNRTDIDNS